MFRYEIQSILLAISDLIKNIKEIKYRDYQVAIANSNIPESLKISLLNRENINKALSDVKSALRKLIYVFKDQYIFGDKFFKPLKEVVERIRFLIDQLKLSDNDSALQVHIDLLEAVINVLETTKEQTIARQKFPTVDALQKLDENWKEIDPDYFREVLALEKTLKSIGKN